MRQARRKNASTAARSLFVQLLSSQIIVSKPCPKCCRIESFFQKNADALGKQQFQVFDDLPPIVTVEQNFDQLLIPPDHVSRQPSDTYYVDAERLLRCHTSAHQTTLLRQRSDPFLACGDVYRRDEVDSTHYPVFHQMEGVRVLSEEEVGCSQRDAPRCVWKSLFFFALLEEEDRCH